MTSTEIILLASYLPFFALIFVLYSESRKQSILIKKYSNMYDDCKYNYDRLLKEFSDLSEAYKALANK